MEHDDPFTALCLYIYLFFRSLVKCQLMWDFNASARNYQNMKMLEEICCGSLSITLLDGLDNWWIPIPMQMLDYKNLIVLKGIDVFPLRYVFIHMFAILNWGCVVYYILMKPYDPSMVNVFEIVSLPFNQTISPCTWTLHSHARSTNVVEWNRKVDTSFDLVTKS